MEHPNLTNVFKGKDSDKNIPEAMECWEFSKICKLLLAIITYPHRRGICFVFDLASVFLSFFLSFFLCIFKFGVNGH